MVLEFVKRIKTGDSTSFLSNFCRFLDKKMLKFEV